MATLFGPYTPVVKAGGFLYCSGQIGWNGTDLEEGLVAQVHQAVANLRALLEENGASLANVVKTTCFLTDMAGFPLFNDAYAEAFGDTKPARSAIAAAALPKAALFEIEAVAYVG